MTQNLELWPALLSSKSPETVNYEHAIWGKAHGARSDYRWLATTEKINRSNDLDMKFYLGGIDKSSELLFWRCLEENNQRRYFAGHTYPSRAIDAGGRGDILERQLLVWQPEENTAITYVVLHCLQTVNTWQDDIWWNRRDEIDWSDENNLLQLDDTTPLKIPDVTIFNEALAIGIEELKQLDSKELINFYARLLSQEKPAILYIPFSLTPKALTALLLPIEQDIVNDLSILANIPPVALHEISYLSRHWDVLVFLNHSVTSGLSSNARKKYSQAERMVQALLENNPALLAQTVKGETDMNMNSEVETQLALWGESESGKTVFLAQLHLHTHGKQSDWDVFPTDDKTPVFIDKMRVFLANNSFPPPTDKDEANLITYEFVRRQSEEDLKANRTAHRASLTVEDVAGVLHSELHEKSMQRMTTAAGLALLINENNQNVVARLFETMLTHRRSQNRTDRKDPRPMAICIPKADSLINSMDSYIHACEHPDTFIRSNPAWSSLIDLLDKYCANYQFFPLSAIGLDPCHGNVEPSTFYDENFKRRVKSKMQPFNLLEPFSWLAQQLGMTGHD